MQGALAPRTQQRHPLRPNPCTEDRLPTKPPQPALYSSRSTRRAVRPARRRTPGRRRTRRGSVLLAGAGCPGRATERSAAVAPTRNSCATFLGLLRLFDNPITPGLGAGIGVSLEPPQDQCCLYRWPAIRGLRFPKGSGPIRTRVDADCARDTFICGELISRHHYVGQPTESE